MAKKIENNPSPSVLMNSMRSIGYSFKTALADIIDNSISACAKNIYIFSPINDDDLFVSILDDGNGMTKKDLFIAMKYGSDRKYSSNDLGRFGLGLKSASLSQCKVLTVVSKIDNNINAYRWDIDSVLEDKKWDCLELEKNEIINDYKTSIYYKELKIKNLLRLPKKEKDYLWQEALECTPNDTKSRKKIWNENPKIVNESGQITNESFIRTITTKQDRHPNSGNIYFDSHIEGKSKFRYRECMLFMGFNDKDYENIINNNTCQRKNTKFFSRDKIIRMAGNSIPVKLLEGFFYQIYELNELISKSR